MAAAACAAAAAVQRAQILMQTKTEDTTNGELSSKTPSKIEDLEATSKEEGGSGDGASSKDLLGKDSEGLRIQSDSEPVANASSSVTLVSTVGEVEASAGTTNPNLTSSPISSPREPISADEQPSLVESSSKESVPRELRNVCAAPGLLKEIIQGKLALAAAAAVARRSVPDLYLFYLY